MNTTKTKGIKMNVTFSGNPVQQKKYSKTAAAAKGALFTAGVLGVSTAVTCAKEPQTMQSVVSRCGGKGKYAAQYAGWLALYSAVGALVSTALTAITNATKPKYPPKAN